jgi:hypothetical protein
MSKSFDFAPIDFEYLIHTLIRRLIPLSQVGPYVVSWPPAPVNRDGCKGAGRGEGTNSERISGWLSG